jgi:hypothetical protein
MFTRRASLPRRLCSRYPASSIALVAGYVLVSAFVPPFVVGRTSFAHASRRCCPARLWSWLPRAQSLRAKHCQEGRIRNRGERGKQRGRDMKGKNPCGNGPASSRGTRARCCARAPRLEGPQGLRPPCQAHAERPTFRAHPRPWPRVVTCRDCRQASSRLARADAMAGFKRLSFQFCARPASAGRAIGLSLSEQLQRRLRHQVGLRQHRRARAHQNLVAREADGFRRDVCVADRAFR